MNGIFLLYAVKGFKFFPEKKFMLLRIFFADVKEIFFRQSIAWIFINPGIEHGNLGPIFNQGSGAHHPAKTRTNHYVIAYFQPLILKSKKAPAIVNADAQP